MGSYFVIFPKQVIVHYSISGPSLLCFSIYLMIENEWKYLNYYELYFFVGLF